MKNPTSFIDFTIIDKDTKEIVFKTILTGVLAEIYRYKFYMFSSMFLKYPDIDQTELRKDVFNPLFYKEFFNNVNFGGLAHGSWN